MDKQVRESRRSSILKLRQNEAVDENTVNDDDQKFHKRRVSFHNVKTVQNFEKDTLNLLDGSPFREKIQETVSSDGVLTPGKSQIALSTSNSPKDDVENTSFMNNTVIISEGTSYRNSVTALDGVDNETMMVFNTQRGHCNQIFDTSRFSNLYGEKYGIDVSSTESGCTYGDYTIDVFKDMRSDKASNRENSDIPDSFPSTSDVVVLQKSIMDVSDMEVTTKPEENSEEGKINGNIGISDVGDFVDTSELPYLGNEIDAVDQVLLAADSVVDNESGDTEQCHGRSNTAIALNIENDVSCSESSAITLERSRLNPECVISPMEHEISSTERVEPSDTRSLEGIRADVSSYHVELMSAHSHLLQSKVEDVSIFRGNQYDDTQYGDDVDIGAKAANIMELSSHGNDFYYESSIMRRDISIMQVGSRFRRSSSPLNETFTIQSLLDESVCFRKRMMFDTHSLQVNYVNPASGQPESNVFRSQISEELKNKLLEMKENASSEVAALYPKLKELYPEKALALKNMDMRALGSDGHELLYCSRLRAEIEWAHIRLEISRKARSELEQSIANDEATLKKLREDVELCNSIEELGKKVQVLQTELNDLPSAEVLAEIIDAHMQAVKEEKDLDRELLDLEIEELRLELELAKAKNKEFSEKATLLNNIADAFEKNYARVCEVVQEIQESTR